MRRFDLHCHPNTKLWFQAIQPYENAQRIQGLPFPPEFVARYRTQGYWEDRTMGHFFDEIFSTYAERIAFLAGNEQVTYHQLARRMERLALHLLKLGVQPLDRFVIQLPEWLEIVDDFPLSKFGKVSKHVQVNQITDKLTMEKQ